MSEAIWNQLCDSLRGHHLPESRSLNFSLGPAGATLEIIYFKDEGKSFPWKTTYSLFLTLIYVFFILEMKFLNIQHQISCTL